MMTTLRIFHAPSGELLAEGPRRVLGIMPFEGGWYVSRSCLRSGGFRPNWRPGLCPYKFLYVGLDLHPAQGGREAGIGWYYWLPNPLLFFTAFRVAIARDAACLQVEESP